MVFELHAHIVFVTKYRKKVFDPDALDKLKRIFRIVCADFEADLKDFNGGGDHVHLLVNYPPKTCLSNLVNSLKGVSSRRLKVEKIDFQKKCYNGALWSPSYFVGSLGGAPLSALKTYIQSERGGASSPN